MSKRKYNKIQFLLNAKRMYGCWILTTTDPITKRDLQNKYSIINSKLLKLQ